MDLCQLAQLNNMHIMGSSPLWTVTTVCSTDYPNPMDNQQVTDSHSGKAGQDQKRLMCQRRINKGWIWFTVTSWSTYLHFLEFTFCIAVSQWYGIFGGFTFVILLTLQQYQMLWTNVWMCAKVACITTDYAWLLFKFTRPSLHILG